MPREIKGNTFDDEVIQSDRPVLAEFYSPSCAPCKNVEQNLKIVEEELGDSVKVVKVNVFESCDQASQFSIMSVPVVIGFINGRIVNSLQGVRPPSEYVNLIK